MDQVMTGGEESEPLAYMRCRVKTWSDQQRNDDYETVTLQGKCSRCGHGTDFRMRQAYAASPGEQAASTRHITVACDCTETHLGGPPGATGCGAYFYISVPGVSDE
mgnify:FL=1